MPSGGQRYGVEVARPAPPSDDGSPARLIAAMVGIVGILLLGSLAWSAVGALVSAVGAAGSAWSSANSAPPTLEPAVAVTPAAPTAETTETAAPENPSGENPAAETPAPTPAVSVTPASTLATTATTPVGTPTPLGAVTATPSAATPTPGAATPTAATTGRNPWILLPQPEPGTRVAPGAIVVEARGRGDAPITAMHLALDGAALPVALDQRSDSTWRGSASTRVTAGEHSVRASVTDAAGRTGSYSWSFTVSAAPAP